MATEKIVKSSFPGLSDKAYKIALDEKNRRANLGLKVSISSVISEAVVKTYGNVQA